MSGYHFADLKMTVTTWGGVEGKQRWRARNNEGRWAEFFAPRDTDMLKLARLGEEALEEARRG